MDLLYLILPIAGLCLLGAAVYFLRLRRHVGRYPVVRRLLEQAIDQRSVMVVEFTAHDVAEGHFFGPCADFDEKTVLIDAALHQELPGCIGKPVLVSFRIDNKGISSYYQFTSCLCGLPRSGGGFGLLLDTPAEIRSNQKRSFVRITPRQELTFGVGIWRLQPTQTRPDEPASLGVAQLSYRQDHQEHMTLLNMSAGGLCLQLKHTQDNQAALDLDPQPGDRLLCLLMLRSLKEERTLPFWLDCTVVNCEKKDGLTNVGLRFHAWAVQHQGTNVVDWFTVGAEGAVGPLGSWILRQQLARLE